MTGRQVRPGEVPRPFSVWSWGQEGAKHLALGLQRKDVGRSFEMLLVSLPLDEPGKPALNGLSNDLIWTGPAFVGVGPVLSNWWCHEEAPDLTSDEAEDIADSDGRLAPAGLR